MSSSGQVMRFQRSLKLPAPRSVSATLHEVLSKTKCDNAAGTFHIPDVLNDAGDEGDELAGQMTEAILAVVRSQQTGRRASP